MDIRQLREKAKGLDSVVRIGKMGVTPNQIAEIKKVLMKRKLIKVKMLPSFFEGKDKREVSQGLANDLGAQLVDLIGNVIVLYKR